MLDELTPNARTVLAELGPKAQTADDLAAATGLAVQAVLAALTFAAGAAVAECEGLLPPKHDAGTATRCV